FFFFDYYTFAFRLAGGRIFGRDRESFRYSLGGFDTLRGYSFDEFEGDKMFIASAEFRFITIEGIKFGFPLYFGIGGIGGVLFVDAGSAWNNKYHLRKSDGSFDDLKSDIGFGFRLALAPAVSLKLDFAWPYNYKSLGSMNGFFSIGIDY
ncbi:MAG TPA: BamA/TamA family outer membrane protein, partial [Spirochaetota bacterium]